MRGVVVVEINKANADVCRKACNPYCQSCRSSCKKSSGKGTAGDDLCHQRFFWFGLCEVGIVASVVVGVAAIMVVMGVGLVGEGPMVDVSVAVVGIAKGWREGCCCACDCLMTGSSVAAKWGSRFLCDRLLIVWDCCHWVVGASGVDTNEWP